MIRILVSLVFILSMNAYAADSSSGCGIGWMVTKSMTTLGSFTRSLTNATFLNTFAMTTGTSGCTQHDLVLNEKQKIHFMESNMAPLQYEVALGNGERLEAMGMIMGCQQESMSHFKTTMKKNSGEIFSDESAPQVLNRMEKVIFSDQTLSSHCII